MDTDLIDLLRDRDGIETIVELKPGARLVVLDIAWGYDHLDDRAHVSTNISPGRTDLEFEFFTTDEVGTVIDPASGAVLWAASRTA